MKLLKWLKRYQTILTVQFVASVLLFYRAHKMNMLPYKYEIILAVILLLLWLIMLKLSKPKKRKYRHEKRKKLRPAFGKFLSIILSIAMFFASNMLAKTNGAIAKITNISYETTVISLITLKDKGLDQVESLNDKTIGINTAVNKSKVSKAASHLRDKIDFKTKEYDDFAKLADALYNHKISAMLIDQSYDTMFLEKHLNFANETQTIWTYKVKVPVKNTKSDIDVTKEPFTVLISGVDSRGDVSEKSRSDVDMLVTINPKTHNILMTSLPRDTFVKIYGIDGRDKLTHSGLFGTKAVKKTIENFMDIKIDFTARVGFQSVIKIVDALDGIDVYSDKAFTAYTDASVHFAKGMMHMNGRQALAFARERHAYTTGDLHRNQNQIAVMHAILKKVMNPSILANYSDLMDAISGTFQTDMQQGDISALIKMQLNSNPKWNVQHSILTGTSRKRKGGYMMPKTAIYYFIADKSSIEQNREYINYIRDGKTFTVSNSDANGES